MRFLIILLLAYLAYQALKGFLEDRGSKQKQVPKQRQHVGGGEDLVEDPYCHTYVPVSDARKLQVEGKTLYFCSKKCLEAFMAKSGK